MKSKHEQGTDLTISSLAFPSEGQFDVSMLGRPRTTNIMMLTNTVIEEIVVDYFDVDYEHRLIENAIEPSVRVLFASVFIKYTIEAPENNPFHQAKNGLFYRAMGMAGELECHTNVPLTGHISQ